MDVRSLIDTKPAYAIAGCLGGLVLSAALGGDPLYFKGAGLELQLNGARAVAIQQAKGLGAYADSLAEDVSAPSTP
jgi:hypothetical protein